MTPTNLLLLGSMSLGAFFLANKSSKATSPVEPVPSMGKRVSLVQGKTYQIQLEGSGGFTFSPDKLDDNKEVLEVLGISVKSASVSDPEHLSMIATATKNGVLIVGLMYRPDPSQPTLGFTYTSVQEVQNVP